jgi:hypothetical protein
MPTTPAPSDPPTERPAVAELPGRPDCQCATHFARLRESIGRMFQKNGADYHTGEQCIAAMLERVGPHNFEFRITERWREPESDEVCIFGELTVTFWSHDPNDEDYLPHRVVRQEIGSQQIKRYKPKMVDGVSTPGQPISLGDDYKGATTDAFKRCVRMIGIGLDAWEKEPQLPYRRSDEEEEARAAWGQRGSSQNAGTPRNAPAATKSTTDAPRAITSASSDPARAALEQRYAGLLAQATGAGFRQGWADTPVGKMTDIQVERYSDVLARFVAQQQRLEPVAS